MTDRWYGVLKQVHLAQIVHDALGYTDDYHGEPNCGIVAERIIAAIYAADADDPDHMRCPVCGSGLAKDAHAPAPHVAATYGAAR